MTPSAGAILATVVPLCCLGGITVLGRGGRGVMPLIVVSLGWGFTSTWVVVGFNDRWASVYGLTSLIVVGAPIMEEVAKSLGTPLLAASRRCAWFVDGTIIGLASGTGFAIRENWVYLDRSGPSDGLDVAIARVTSTNLMHAGCAAIVGAAIAMSWTRAWTIRILFALASSAIAMGLHSTFNRLTQEQNPSALLISLTGIGVFGVASGIVALGVPISQRWARSDLARRGANESEQQALSGGRHLPTLLDDFEARYGTEAAAGAERLIEVQRRIAIGRTGGRLTASELRELEHTADEERRRLGLHAMLWLRSHLPVDPTAAGLLVRLELVDDPGSPDEPMREVGGLWARLDVPENGTSCPTETSMYDRRGDTDAVFPV